jgi:hypothetical protein
VKASLFGPAAPLPAGVSGFAPLQGKVHAVDARLAGALADWFASVYVAEARRSARNAPRCRRAPCSSTAKATSSPATR